MPKCPTVFASAMPGSETPDSTPIYRHPDFVTGLKDEFMPGVKTMWDVVVNTVKTWPNANCHGVREVGPDGKAGGFKWMSYQQVFNRVTAFAAGIKPYVKSDVTGELKLLGLMGLNAPEWTATEWACLGLGVTTVPFYTTTPKETLEYLINFNGCAVVVADALCAATLLKAKPSIPSFTTLVVYGKGDMTELKKTAEGLGLKLLTFQEVVDAGKGQKDPFEPPTANSVFSFIYTSGSTGMPKGALLTHEALMSLLAASFYNVEKAKIPLRPGGKEYHLSYLPSAHVMERTFQLYIVSLGGSTGFYQGKREQLTDDIKMLRPTLFPSVPRLLNLIHDKIMNKVRSTGGIGEKLFMAGLNAKIAHLKAGKLKSPLWDTLVFNNIKKQLGFDRVKVVLTGSAPIAGAVLDFYRAAFGILVMEGYGATETCTAGTMTHPLHFSSEHVGGPSPDVDLKLVSIPSMNYLVTDKEHTNKMKILGRGEICVRGKFLMREYYRNPEATAKAIDKDGFYHTGDVGLILPNGCVKIVDRVGNVFKLSIGEYVAPEKVENICSRSHFVQSIFVHGDAFHPKLVSIVVPDPEYAATWAKENGVAEADVTKLANNEAFRKAILADLEKIGKKNSLQSYEIPKDVFIEPVPFSVDNVLTPTLKMQRKKAVEYYGAQLSAMLGAAS